MFSFDPRDLLKEIIADGFTIESICKATGFSADFIEKLCEKQHLTYEELDKARYLTAFVVPLYITDAVSDKYLSSMVEALNYSYGVSNKVIEKYLGLEQDQLVEFLANPNEFPNGHIIERKLFHLFTTFVRDKQH